MSILVIVGLVLWLRMISELKYNKYEVTYFHRHFANIANMIELIQTTNNRTERKYYIRLLLGFIAVMIAFIVMLVLSVKMDWF